MLRPAVGCYHGPCGAEPLRQPVHEHTATLPSQSGPETKDIERRGKTLNYTASHASKNTYQCFFENNHIKRNDDVWGQENLHVGRRKRKRIQDGTQTRCYSVYVNNYSFIFNESTELLRIPTVQCA